MFKVYCRSKDNKEWKEYSQPFVNLENAEKCKKRAEGRMVCDTYGNVVEYKIMEIK